MITYRKATVDDVDILAKIRSVFLVEIGACSEEERDAYEIANRDYFKSALSDDSFAAWLAVETSDITNSEKIVATSGLSFSLSPPSLGCIDGRQAYIMNMYTLPEYRKRGIGYELFERIAGEAKSRGYKKITLNATDIGKPLYEKYGFIDVIGDMVYYG